MKNPADRFDLDDRLDLLYLGSQLGAHVVVAWILGDHGPRQIHHDIARLFVRLRAEAPSPRSTS